MKTLHTRPPVPCLTLIVSCPRRRGHEFQARFGPQTFNLMSLDSNCRRGRNTSLLPHYSPYPTPYSSGVNVFAQTIQMEHNVYVFPPFVLVGPLLRYFFDQRQCFSFTVIAPRLQRHRYWWAILQAMVVDSFLLGRKGDQAVLLFLPAPPRVSLLGLTLESVRFSLYLLLVSCVYRSNAHGSLPTDVPPALIQTTVTRTFAKPAVKPKLREPMQGARSNADMPLINL